MAWDLLLNVFELDQNRLLITYFGGDAQTGLAEDEQTRRIWLDLGYFVVDDCVIFLSSA